MDLKLDILRTTGRATKPLTAELGRSLRESDLVLLEVEKGSKPEPLQKLRSRHHALAKAIAMGKSPGDAAILTGYSASRVSILLDDPTFQELLGFYRRIQDEAFKDMHEQLAALGTDAVEELHERLEANPEDFSNTMLLEIVTKTADRTGYGPQTKTTNVNLHVGVAARMEAARKRVGAVLRGNIEDAEIVPGE